jgi:hypothetical protein
MENVHDVNSIRKSESYGSVRKPGTVLLYAAIVFIHDAASLPAEPVNEIRQGKHRSTAVNRRPQSDGFILQSTYNSVDSSRGTNKNYLFKSKQYVNYTKHEVQNFPLFRARRDFFLH